MMMQSYGWNLQRLQHSRNKSLDHTDDVHELCFSQLSTFSIPCYRHHLSYGDCLEAEMEDNQNCCVLCCVRRTCKQFLELICTLVVFRFVFCVFVCVCYLPFSVWHCCLGARKIIRPIKIEWWGVGVVVCLEQGPYVPADAIAIPKPHHLLSHLNPV